MARQVLPALAAATLAVTAAVPATVRSADTGLTAQGKPFVTGGLSEEERRAMRHSRMDYSLWLQAASLRGAYLPGLRVRIEGQGESRVLELRLNGPWLFVNLAEGTYQVAVTSGGVTESRRAVVRGRSHLEMVFYFDEPAEERQPAGAVPSVR